MTFMVESRVTGVIRAKWKASDASFARFLAWIDGGGDSQGEEYLALRQRLVAYFERKGCDISDELADQTLERVNRLLVPAIVERVLGNGARPALHMDECRIPAHAEQAAEFAAHEVVQRAVVEAGELRLAGAADERGQCNMAGGRAAGKQRTRE